MPVFATVTVWVPLVAPTRVAAKIPLAPFIPAAAGGVARPPLLSPQHRVWPPDLTAHVYESPALTAVTPLAAAAGGVAAPPALLPQQKTPPFLSAHECAPPAAICVTPEAAAAGTVV
jgi:hypothetical protein